MKELNLDCFNFLTTYNNMMSEMKAPSFERVLQLAVHPDGPTLENPGYLPDEYPGKGDVAMPPTAPPLEMWPQEKRMPLVDLGTLRDKDVREACYNFAAENCCYGSRFIKDTQLPEIFNGCIYHYQLETFGEKRETVERFEPFKDGYVDGPQNGVPPLPWDIQVSTPTLFKDSRFKVEIPHTAYVKHCGTCLGNSRLRCEHCSGLGGNYCLNCAGSGLGNGGTCIMCSGRGRRQCCFCHGRGRLKCVTCNGKGKLRHFKLLIVTWRNHKENYMTHTFKLPKQLILEASGRKIFNEEHPRVYPIDHARDESVNTASGVIIKRHSTAFPQELIIKQRHSLRAIPLVRATYSWKNKKGEFYVYGLQKKVYFEDYPQKYCCCTCC